MKSKRIIVKIKYLTIINGLPYFQRKYPKALEEHPSLTSALFKRRLKSSLDDELALVAEVKSVNLYFEDYVDTLKAGNASALKEIDIENKARRLLEHEGLTVGMGSSMLEEDKTELESHHYYHNPAFKPLVDHHLLEDELQHPVEKSLEVKVVERALSMLTAPTDPASSSHMLSEAWNHHINETGKDVTSGVGKKEQGIWNKFIGLKGDTRLTQENVNSLLREFALTRAKDGLKADSISRQLTTIITAIKDFCEEKDLNINVVRPKMPKSADKSKAIRAPLSHTAQIQLVTNLHKEPEWKELFILLALNTGSNPKELLDLTSDSFDFKNKPPRVLISPEGKVKTEARERVVPLVYKPERIKELIGKGALTTLTSKSPDNASQQITQVVKKAQPRTTAYSLRHTLRHNADSAGIDPNIQAQLGGWEAKRAGLNAHMFRYGKGGADYEERLKPLSEALTKCLAHLPT